LRANGNALTQLPERIGNLMNLKMLALGRNALTELPTSFQRLTNLQELGIGSNKFREFPKEICFLHDLRELYIEKPSFTTLPIEFYNLVRLEILIIWVREWSPELGRMRNLRRPAGGVLCTLRRELVRLRKNKEVEFVDVVAKQRKKGRRMTLLAIESSHMCNS